MIVFYDLLVGLVLATPVSILLWLLHFPMKLSGAVGVVAAAAGLVAILVGPLSRKAPSPYAVLILGAFSGLAVALLTGIIVEDIGVTIAGGIFSGLAPIGGAVWLTLLRLCSQAYANAKRP